MIILSATSMSVTFFIVVCANFQKIHKENAKVAFRLSLVTLTRLMSLIMVKASMTMVKWLVKKNNVLVYIGVHVCVCTCVTCVLACVFVYCAVCNFVVCY